MIGVSKHYRAPRQPRRSLRSGCLPRFLPPRCSSWPYGSAARARCSTVVLISQCRSSMTWIVIRSHRSMPRPVVGICQDGRCAHLLGQAARGMAHGHRGCAATLSGLALRRDLAEHGVGDPDRARAGPAAGDDARHDDRDGRPFETATGLRNRRGFEVHGDAMVATAMRRARPLTLVTVDIDRFKTINDRHGHCGGRSRRSLRSPGCFPTPPERRTSWHASAGRNSR